MLTINNTLDGYLKDVEIKGNTVQDASNLADIRSVGEKIEGQELYEIPVLSCGKNLANVTLWYDNKTINSTGTVVDEVGSNSTVSEFISIAHLKEAIDYAIPKPINTTGGITIAFYDMNKAFLSRVFTSIFTVPSEAKYIRVKTGIDNKQTFQLEVGTQATSYEPYQEDKLTILSPVQLEKVGDVADRIICKDGVWGVEKNVNSYIVSRDDIQSRGVNGNGYNRFNINLPNIKLSSSLSIRHDIINPFTTQYCSMDELYISTQNCITVSTDTVVVLDVNNPTLESFRKKIVDNKFVYLLDTPTFIPLPHDQQVKLRTFANKTNISFLTEIEGTIKAQVPKSLGATVNTHTEQINNLNKELDRVKKLEESTVSTVETESDFTTVEATSNGYFEDVKLEGKTLVNLWDISKMREASSISVTDNYVTVNADGSWIDCHPVYTAGAVPMLKPNTEYTVIAHIKNNTLNNCMSLSVDNADRSPFAKEVVLEQGFTGYYICKLNTKTDLSKSTTSLRCQVPNTCTTGSIIFNCIVLEGDHTQNPPSYFEGLKSVGQSASEDGADEIVVSSVKGDGNLFDFTQYTSNGNVKVDYVDDNKIIIQGISGWYAGVSADFKVKPNTRYLLKTSGKSLANNSLVACSVSDVKTNTVIHVDFDATDVTKEITTISDSIRITLKCNNETNTGRVEYNNIMLVEQGNSIEYTPYQSDKKRLLYYNNETQAWEKPILREWDSIEKHADGKYYYHQRSAEVVLNGSEDWYSADNYIQTTYASNNRLFLNKSCLAICNNFEVKYGGEGIYLRPILQNEVDYIRIENALGKWTIESFKQWLQANPTTLVYQLAQEKVYECTNIDLITYSGETNYVVESGAIVPRTTLKVHNNISNVVSLLQKKVSLLESDITSYMITQNRLMLASRYNADTVSFKVDVSMLRNSFEYDNDLYELILNNILVGKDNYNREYIENLIIFYWMDFVISDEMYLTLFEIIEEQHNPKVIEEETPLI